MHSLYAFLVVVLTVALGLGWFLRGTLKELAAIAKSHARIYAIAYTKGGAYILIAVGMSYEDTFKTLTKADASQFPWWVWGCLFWKPIGAGLVALAAFLDRSAQRATETKNQINQSQVP